MNALRKKILGFLALIFIFSLIPSGFSMLTQIPNEDWVISQSSILRYHVEVRENNSQGSFVDALAQEYHFFDLEEDFFGEPEIEVNITEITPTTNLSSVVANILNYASGQLEVSQKIGDNWNSKNLILPFIVPINQWDALTTEFEAQLPGAGNAHMEFSWVGEYIYKLSWYEDDPESEGRFSFFLQLVWEEADGILQAMFLDIGDSQLDYDRLTLRLSGQKLNNSLDSADITKFIIIIVVFAVFFIGVVFGTKKFVKRQTELQANQESLKPVKKEKFDKSRDRQDTAARQDELGQLSEQIATHRRNLVFIWPLAQICSVGVVGGAIQILDLVSLTAQNDTPILLTIIGAMGVIIALTIVFNIPFFRFNKIINREISAPFRTYSVDVTPFITSVSVIGGILLVELVQSLETVSTPLGKAVLIGLLVILSFIIIFAYWVLNPWKALKRVETLIEDQHRFPSSEEKIINFQRRYLTGK